MMKKPPVYIIILNYNSCSDTLECVQCIQDLNYDNFNYLVIDNGSGDDSRQRLRQKIDSNKLLLLEKNTGYAEGNNIGIRYALKNHAEYVFILNPDIRIQKNALDNYVKIMESESNIGALNPVQLTASGSEYDDKFKRSIFLHSIGIEPPPTISLENQLWQAKTLLGAAILFRCSALIDVGGFDPLFFAYGEEEDLCRRMNRQNHKLSVTAISPVLHLRTHENNGISKFVLFLRLRGHYMLMLKNHKASFIVTLKKIINDTCRGIVGKNVTEYNFTPGIYAKVLVWLLANIFRIYRHKKSEETVKKLRYIS